MNPSVNQANIGQTICVTGWTASVRPPPSVTTAIKAAQLASGYTYNGDTLAGDYEEDHLIALELGGSPNAETNLWPQPNNGGEGAHVKDNLENKLHTLVCDRSISLETAQQAIAVNWWGAYQSYIAAVPAPAPAPAPPAPVPVPPAPVPAPPAPVPVPPAPVPAPPARVPAPAPAPAGPGSGATALCNDGTYSYAAHHQGACSHHGGVQVFYK